MAVAINSLLGIAAESTLSFSNFNMTLKVSKVSINNRQLCYKHNMQTKYQYREYIYSIHSQSRQLILLTNSQCKAID